MRRKRRLRRTVFNVLALWGVLLSGLLFSGTLPEPLLGRTPYVRRTGPPTGETPSQLQQAPPPQGEPPAPSDSVAGAGVVPEPQPPPPMLEEVPRYRLCRAAPHARPVLSRVQLGPKGAEAFAVHCGAEVGLLIFDELAAGLPRRIARLTVDAPDEKQRLQAAPLVAGRLGHAGAPLLIVPVRWDDELDIPRDGRLVALPIAQGLGRPRPYASAMAADLLTAPLFGDQGDALAVLQLEDPKVRTPSELWVLRGGARSQRVASVPAGLRGLALATLDLDRNGQSDLAVVSEREPELMVLLNPGREVQQRREQRLPGARQLQVGDLDADGHTDLLVTGSSVWWVRAEAEPSLTPTVLKTPDGLRDVHLLDVNSDGHLDLIGYAHPRVHVLQGLGDGRFESTSALEFAGEDFSVVQVSVADVDGDGGLEVLVIGFPSADPQLVELAVVKGIGSDRRVRLGSDSGPLPPAPLTYSYRL